MTTNADPLHTARVLATLTKLSGGVGEVDLENADELWALGVREDDLWVLGQKGVISFDSVGEEGFKPIVLCSVTEQAHAHLLTALSEAGEHVAALEARIEALLQHNPEKLRLDIAQSAEHIKQAREQIAGNSLLSPLSQPLEAIAAHFDSISRVAKSYDDVYNNVLKPMQDEGRRGIQATVKWAVIGIVASWVLSNYATIRDLVVGAAGAG